MNWSGRCVAAVRRLVRSLLLLFPEQVEEREEPGKQNGGLYQEEEEEEEEEAPKQHRKAERTLRCIYIHTHTATGLRTKQVFCYLF